MRFRSTILVRSAAAGALLLPIPGTAHHPLDEVYSRDSQVTLTGIVLRVDWVNPHASFRLRVVDDAGVAVEWLVEIDYPSALLRRGWTERSLAAGHVVTVEGFLALDDSRQAYARTVTLPGGETLIASTDASWSWRRTADIPIAPTLN